MITTKYNNMISAFQADFDLAVNGCNDLIELDKKIKNKDIRLLNDIDLLSELEFGLRYGKLEIHEV